MCCRMFLGVLVVVIGLLSFVQRQISAYTEHTTEEMTPSASVTENFQTDVSTATDMPYTNEQTVMPDETTVDTATTMYSTIEPSTFEPSTFDPATFDLTTFHQYESTEEMQTEESNTDIGTVELSTEMGTAESSTGPTTTPSPSMTQQTTQTTAVTQTKVAVFTAASTENPSPIPTEITIHQETVTVPQKVTLSSTARQMITQPRVMTTSETGTEGNSSCSEFNTCLSCVNSLYCGWCVSETRCLSDETCAVENWLKNGDTPQTRLNNQCGIIDLLGGYTIEFEPDLGIIDGDTDVDLTLWTDKKVSLDLVSIHIAGIPCGQFNLVMNSTSTTHDLNCTTQQSVVSNGPVTINIIVGLSTLALTSDSNFTYVDPEIDDFEPSKGPRAGGTTLSIYGQHLNITRNVDVIIGGQPCEINWRAETHLSCLTSPVSQPSESLISVIFDGRYTRQSVRNYFYQEDPTIETIFPLSTFIGGGIMQMVTGTNLNVIARPLFVVSVVTNSSIQNFYSICIEVTMTTMSCPTPELTIYSNKTAGQNNNNNNNNNNTISRRRRSGEDEDSCPYLTSDPITGQDALFLVGFVLDGDSRWLPENIFRHLSSKYTHIDVIWNPIVYNFSDPQYPSSSVSDILIFDPEESAYLVIKGKGMDCGAQKTDVKVQIGTDFCRVISLYSNEMACIPPEHKPPVRNEYRRVHGHPQVLVQFGTFEKNSYFVGYLQYVEKGAPLLDPWIVVIIVLIFLLILIILIAVIIFLFLRWRNKEHVKRRVIKTVEIDHVYKSLFIGDDWRHDPYSYLDKDMKHDIETVKIDRKDLKIHEKEILGQGHKGIVVKGTIHHNFKTRRSPQEVAVKMLRGDVALDDLRRFLLEGVLMKDFDHPNVLSLIGVCIQRDGLPLIVLPYMKNGDLKSFITTQSREFTLKDLLTFALNIAEGMAYLSERKFVHRDLASRNCMVDERNVVKVSDFGLSRDIYEREYYSTKDKTVKLPVKWMAPESFRRQIFTTKTDVWSFGVLVWELVTRGEVPYGSVDNWDLLRYIDTGKRLNQPHFTPDEVYGLMLQCWHSDPDNRPDFKTLVEELKQILQIPYQSSDVKPLYLEIIG